MRIFSIFKKQDIETQEEMDALIEKRENYSYQYNKPLVLRTISGSYKKWWEEFCKEAKITVILGARRTGKGVIAFSLAENLAKTNKLLVYSIGTEDSDLPNFIENIEDIDELPNDCVLVVGEGGIENNSRDSMTTKNKDLTKLLSVVSHKRIWLIYASQTSAKLEVSLLRESDNIIMLKPSLMMKEMDRPVIKKLYKEYTSMIKRYTEKVRGKGVCIMYSQEWVGCCRFKLPSFWSDSISTSYKDKEVVKRK